MTNEIKSQDLLNLLGLPAEEATSLDAIREKFEQTYVPLEALKDPKNPHTQSLAPAFVGKVTGVTTTALKRKLKAYGLDLTAEEMKDKPLEQLVELGLEKLSESQNQKLKSLEEQLGQSSDQKRWKCVAMTSRPTSVVLAILYSGKYKNTRLMQTILIT